MENVLKGSFGFKGARGYSAYEIAVQNGFEGTEKDWLATLGTSEHMTRTVTKITVSTTRNTFTVSSELTNSSIVDVYVNGLRKAEGSYTLDTTLKTITFTESLKSGDILEVYISRMRTSELPIVTTISDTSTDDTAPSAKAVNDLKKEIKNEMDTLSNGLGVLSVAIDNKLEFSNIHVITGSSLNISAGETVIVDVNYPNEFDQSNTVIISKMVSSNNNYYDTSDETATVSGFPIIKMIALTSSTIRIWLKNTSSTTTRNGYFKITLLKTTAY